MLSAVLRLRAPVPLSRHGAWRWLPSWLRLSRPGAAVTVAGDVASAGASLGVAVRREWPDGRHDLFGFTHDVEAAMEALEGERRFWRRGPVMPTAIFLVAVSEQVVKSHPRSGCRVPSCPGYPMGESR